MEHQKTMIKAIEEGDVAAFVSLANEIGADILKPDAHGRRLRWYAEQANATEILTFIDNMELFYSEDEEPFNAKPDAEPRLRPCDDKPDFSAVDIERPRRPEPPSGIPTLVPETGFRVDSYDYHTLRTAIEKNDVEAVKLLLAGGANDDKPEYRPGEGELFPGEDELYAECLEWDEDYQPDDDGKRWHTSLHIAVKAGAMDVLRYMLEKGGNINAVDYKGNTLLHVAMASGNMEVARFLVNQGADINKCNEMAVGIMCYAHSEENAAYLIEQGINMTSASILDFTLYYERVYNHPEWRERISAVIRAALKAGLRIEINDWKYGLGIDHYDDRNAAENEILWALLCLVAEHVQDTTGLPFDYLLSNGYRREQFRKHPEILKKLVEKAVSIPSPSKLFLQSIVADGHSDIIELLHAKKALDSQCLNFVLREAEIFDQKDIERWALDHGASKAKKS